ncbi:MAG: DUF6513 domain-containing protein [Planctomycetota bacterium]
MSQRQIHFVTGRLAENALLEVLHELAESTDFKYTVEVLPISVAALMTAEWIAKKINIPENTDLVVVPGYCQGNFDKLAESIGIPFAVGPKDVKRLPEFFGKDKKAIDLTKSDIQIIAEINHAPRYGLEEFLAIATRLKNEGADLIDIGCIPGAPCNQIGDYAQILSDHGISCSVDSLNVQEISAAAKSGAQLVLSVNQTNLKAAVDWGIEVVVIPDDIRQIDSLETSIDWLVSNNVPLRIDPILEPIGLGFADSLNRYYEARKRWPELNMMMGIGNLTESRLMYE